LPPQQPIETLDELARVLGTTPEVLAALRLHPTVYGSPVPDPRGADPIVSAALAFVREGPVSASTVPGRGAARS
jgi:hypothetical protein